MNKQIMNVRRSSPRHRGIALVLVMIAVGVAVVLSLTFVVAQGTSHGIAQNVQHHAQARHIAESGLAMTIAHVQNTSDWRTVHANGQWVANEAFAGGMFTITGVDEEDGDLADDTSDPVRITSTGTYQGVTHSVNAVVTPQTSGFPDVDISLMSTVDVDTDAEIDSFDSRNGAYGGGNSGSEALVMTNTTQSSGVHTGSGGQIEGDVYVGVGGDPGSVIDGSVSGTEGTLTDPVTAPAIDVPGDSVVGPLLGNGQFNSNATISGNQHYDNFQIDSGATVRISGDVTILVEQNFQLTDGCEIRLNPGASLTIYVLDTMQISSASHINLNTGDPTLTTIYLPGMANDIDIKEESWVYGTVIAPQRKIKLSKEGHIAGRLMAGTLEMIEESGVHYDVNPDYGGGSGGGSGDSGFAIVWQEQ